MKVEFWLLDVTYGVKEDDVLLWGIDGKGKRVAVVDRGFRYYFYLVPKKDSDVTGIIDVAKAEADDNVLGFEVVRKKMFGRPVEAIKVVCRNHRHSGSLAKRLSKIKEASILEEDIRYSDRYLIDNDVVTSGWHEVEVKEVRNEWGYAVDTVYEALKPPMRSDKIEVPQLRTLSFSLDYYAPLGSSSQEAFLATLSVKANGGEVKQFLAKDNDDREIVAQFVKLIDQYDPDIIVGYGSNSFDWGVLLRRADIHGLKFGIGRDGTKPHTSVYGHVSVAGRANVDLLNHIERVPDIKLKDVTHAAIFYGIKLAREVKPVSPVEIPSLWKDEKEKLLRFSRQKAELIHQMSIDLLPFLIQLSSVIGLPLDQVAAAAIGFRAENNIMRHAFKENELIPKRKARPYFPYKGAIVLSPEPGLHENVAVMDFSSMYPNLMIKYNLSPDTLVPKTVKVSREKVNKIAEVGYKFMKSPDGLYRKLLRDLIEVRRSIRNQMKKYPHDSLTYKILDGRQKAIKIVTNATYGYAGWIGARWYVREVAESAAALGRETINRAIDVAKGVGLNVLYADTDSIMAINEPDKIKALEKRIEKEVGIDIKPDKFYNTVLFTKAKKKYAGLGPSGEIDIVGFESVRGDWAEVARETQRRMIEMLLKGDSVEKVRSYAEGVLGRIKDKEFPIEHFIIWKTLTKPVEEYKARAPHVYAAKRLFEAGGKLEAGDKIGFVVVKGEGKLYERAVPYALAKYDEIDFDYYIDNQVTPLVKRCLEVLEES